MRHDIINPNLTLDHEAKIGNSPAIEVIGWDL